MSNLPPYRMVGRANAVGHHLLQKYSLSPSDPDTDIVVLLLALGQRVSDADRDLCNKLAIDVHYDRQQAESRMIASDQLRKEQIAGENEAAYLLRKYPGQYAEYVLADRDYLPEVKAHEEDQKRRRRRLLMTAGSIIGALILGIIIYNLPYFAEKRAFGEAEKDLLSGEYWTYEVAVGHYMYLYPDGAHLQDVLMLAAKACCEASQPSDAVKYASDYLRRFPDGKYAGEVSEIYDMVWNSEIARFNELAAANATKEGADFVRAMLSYMREKHINTVAVEGHPTLELMEYDEYPQGVRVFMETLNNKETGSMKLPDDMETIKDKISLTEARSYTSIIVEGLQVGFDKVLTPGFITFTEHPGESDAALPKAIVDYTIKTQDQDFGSFAVPDIWEYTSTMNGIVMSRCLLLGIGMTFNATFVLPDSDIHYTVTGTGDAGSESINVDRSKAYATMCRRCTQRFSETIASDFGI